MYVDFLFKTAHEHQSESTTLVSFISLRDEVVLVSLGVFFFWFFLSQEEPNKQLQNVGRYYDE